VGAGRLSGYSFIHLFMRRLNLEISEVSFVLPDIKNM